MKLNNRPFLGWQNSPTYKLSVALLSYAGGILVAALQEEIPQVFFATIMGIALLGAIALKRNHLKERRTLLVIAIAHSIGSALYFTHEAWYDQIHEEIASFSPHKLEGRVSRQIRIDNHEDRIELSRLKLINRQNETLALPATLGVTLCIRSAHKPLCSRGDLVSVSSVRIAPPKNELRATCIRNRSLGYIFSSPQQISLREPPRREVCTLRKFADQLSPSVRELFYSIVCGESHELSGKMRMKFAGWGISHMLARSGLHVGILGVALYGIGAHYIPLYLLNISTLAILLAYTHATKPSVSFWRALWLYLLLMLAWFLGAKKNSLYLLLLIAAYLLIETPQLIFFADFQLSFAASFALIWALRRRDGGAMRENR